MAIFPEWHVYCFDSTAAQQSATYLNINNLKELPTLKMSSFAFVFNAKSFAVAILFFFLYRPFSLEDCQKIFSQRFKSSYQESVWPRSGSFLGHTKKYFLKYCFLSCYSWHVPQMTCRWTVTSIHNIQKGRRNSQKLEKG